MSGGPTWPLADLRLRVDDLELAPMTERDLDLITDILPADVELNPRATRFPKLDELTSRAIILRQGYWKALGTWSPAAWELQFVVRVSGAPIGVQVVEGTEFPSVRTVDSASWLVEHQRGRGHGKAMRLAVLALAFDHLGALAAITAAWENNLASLGVSRAIGYLSNGVSLQRRDNSLETMVHLRLSREDWLSRERPTVEVAGLDAALPLFGQ